MAGYMKLTLAVVLVAFVGACMAGIPFDYEAFEAAQKAVYGSEILPYETTENNLKYIRDRLENDGVIMLMEDEKVGLLISVRFYLSACAKEGWFKSLRLPFIGKFAINDMIKDVRQHSNSPNLISYLEECKTRFY